MRVTNFFSSNAGTLTLVTLLLLGSLQFIATDTAEDFEDGEVEDVQDETTGALSDNGEELVYESPKYDASKFHFVDHFDNLEESRKRWTKSQAKKDDTAEEIAKYDGKWEWEAPQRIVWKKDIGLVLKSKAKHAAIAAPLVKPFSFDGDKPLVVQYEVTLQDGQECGGSYIKLLSEGKYTKDLTKLDSPTGVERIRVADVIELKEFISKTPAQSYEYYFYNNAISDKIGSLRALPDTRDERCAAHTYRLPPAARSKVSIVITYHNEARSALIRTIMSVHKRTPAKYLHEIILIDDYSDDDTILPVLSQLNFPPFAHNKTLSNTDALIWPVNIGLIKMQRNPRRLGLIESRNLGARLATGDYLLFLDSHCEVNVGWLEPMLERIAHAAVGRSARNVNTVAVSPVLDIIDTETLDYRASSKNLMGGFDWNLHFHWVQRQNIEQNDKEAFRSPVFSGGIFMISRNWFFKLNAFNSLLEVCM
ncbi:putative polypeptide N-acetylgalactosaminyltransferase 13 [Teleopsis dalmanni]|uniref:putative polypeptide N-acetylgalactosaminyltransferase 13 n=1 Tax=Teleopsis dalmanni TaxID=139649 RepID=UPI0018CDEDD2|nr:putative polypeptide N-acetylgalactosaminyltransferase 13 [Teleopsis dalmanni]